MLTLDCPHMQGASTAIAPRPSIPQYSLRVPFPVHRLILTDIRILYSDAPRSSWIKSHRGDFEISEKMTPQIS